MSKEYVIEDGIPVPPRQPRGGRPKGSGFRGAVAKLGVGQSVAIDYSAASKSSPSDLAHAAVRYCKRTGMVPPAAKFAVRKVEGGARIWRIA